MKGILRPSSTPPVLRYGDYPAQIWKHHQYLSAGSPKVFYYYLSTDILIMKIFYTFAH